MTAVVDDTAPLYAAIAFLFTTLSAVAGGIIRHLLGQIAERDKRLVELSQSGAETTATLNRMVNSFIDAEERRAKRESGA